MVVYYLLPEVCSTVSHLGVKMSCDLDTPKFLLNFL